MEHGPQYLPFQVVFLEEVHHPRAEGHGEYGVGGERARGMDYQPAAFQGRIQGADRRRKEGGSQDHEKRHRHDEGAE